MSVDEPPLPELVEFAGFPQQPTFSLGGRRGNIVTSSTDPRVSKGLRVVSINGKAPPAGEATFALGEARRNGCYRVAFIDPLDRRRLSTRGLKLIKTSTENANRRRAVHSRGNAEAEEKAKRDDERRKRDAQERRLREEEKEKERERIKQKEEETKKKEENEKRRKEAEQKRQEAERKMQATEKRKKEEDKRRAEEVKKKKKKQEDERRKQEEARGEEERKRRKKQEEEQTKRHADERKRTEEDEQKKRDERERERKEEEERQKRDVPPASEPPTTKINTVGALASLKPKGQCTEPQRSLLLALASPAPVVKTGPCDKCNGPHHADHCPNYPKQRDKHKDAWSGYGKTGENGDEAKSVVVKGRVLPQPGDGSCLFHSLAHACSYPSGAIRLRADVAAFVASHASTAIGGTPIRDWVLWDSGLTPEAYAKRMGTGSHWGGAIEMAVCARLQGVRVCVFESTRGGRYQQIAAFETGPAQRDVHVVYSGRCHYDALLVSK